MAGNSKRKGAIRKAGSKKGAQVGTGGKGRKALEGKGPTPKAEDRPYHKAYQRKQQATGKGTRTRRPLDGEIVMGRNSVLEALRAGVTAEELYLFGRIDADDRVGEAVQLALDTNVPVHEVPKTRLDEMTDGASHQGIVLKVGDYEYASAESLLDHPRPLIIALDSIQDPRNLGAIVRSAAAFGATGVLVPERRAARVTVAAWKTSAGAVARIPIARVTNLVRTLEDFKKQRVFVLGLAGDGDVALAESPLLDEPLVVVVGSEGQGLGRLVRETCDQVASIPIEAATESLNASVAASLALYEVARRR